VYFIAPTTDNLKRVVEDCSKQLYRTVFLNFTTRIDRAMLETFAHDLVAAGAHGMVSKIVDQYMDVVALEASLFSLNLHDSFLSYNEPSLSEQQVLQFMTRMATGLLSATRVLSTVPIIR
jgi:sec1 family domain-containing protein 1